MGKDNSMDIEGIGLEVEDWIVLARDRDIGWGFVNMVMKGTVGFTPWS
jgi:hypothetical protein